MLSTKGCYTDQAGAAAAMPKGLPDALPRDSVEIEPGATPVPGAGERVAMLFGSVAATLKDVSDELQGTADPEAAGEILQFRGRLLKALEHERSQLAMMGLLGVNVLFLMLQLLTDCHIKVAEHDPTCIDDLLHSLSTLVVLVFAVETALLLYCLRGVFFEQLLYAVDLVCVAVALVFGVLFDTDAFSLLLLSRSWRVATFVVRRFDLQKDLSELVEREVSTATRDMDIQNQQLVRERAMLANRIADLERDILDAEPILGGGSGGGGLAAGGLAGGGGGGGRPRPPLV